MEERRVVFRNRDGQQMVGTLTRTRETPARGVLVLHGFRGDREERHIVAVSEAIARAGFTMLRIDITNGTGESDGEFRHCTVSHEIADAEDALTFLRQHSWTDDGQVGITGHSVGGLVAALTAARNRSVGAVVTLSAVFDLADRFSRLLGASAMQGWKQQGKIEMDPPGSGLYLDHGFYLDAAALDVPETLGRLHAPLLVIQGDADTEVPPSDADLFHTHAASPAREKIIIPGAGHHYREPPQLEQVCTLTAGWFRKHLTGA